MTISHDNCYQYAHPLSQAGMSTRWKLGE